MKRLVLLSALVLATGFARREGRLRVVDKDNFDAQRVSAFLSLSTDNRSVEFVPDGVDDTAVADDVLVTTFTEDRVCVHVTLRTWDHIDRPMSDWSFELNGDEVWPSDTDVQTAHKEYPFTEQRSLLDIHIGPLARFRLDDIEDGVFRVTEQDFDLCSSSPTWRGRIQLEVRLRQEGYGGPLGMNYRWEVQR